MNDLANARFSSSIAAVPSWWLAAAVTAVFAVLGRAVRGVTTSGAAAGAIVCLAVLWGAGWSGFAGLCAVFILTWVATRFGYSRKQKLGTAERRGGRTASQVLANVGVAAVCSLVFAYTGDLRWLLCMGAALAEAAADTVSSEIGQAVGGVPRLITTWQVAPPGTDGGITLAGTAAGVISAVLVALTLAGARLFGAGFGFVCAGVGVVGMLFDSILGATLERRGILDNNGVNFCSTLLAAGIALAIS